MTQMNQNQIPVTFINLFTRHRLAQAVLPALPAAGDDVYVRDLGYEVVNPEWILSAEGKSEITVILRPQMDANEQHPLKYEEEERDG
ncbi:MAG: hypothetical protein ACE5FD_01490 [Anaerolineae bacterium]